MKKLLQFSQVLTFCFIIINLKAQHYTGGLRMDYSIMKWTFKSTNPFEELFPRSVIRSLHSFTMSFPLEYKLNERISIQTELGFARRGFSVHFSGYDYTGSVAFRFRYINLPLTAKVFLNSGDKQFYLLAGPSISRTLGATVKAIIKPFGGPKDEAIEKLDLDDFPRTRTDFGMNFGLGWVKKDRKGGSVFIETRYYHGLKRLSEVGAKEDIYHRGITFSMGLMYPIFKNK